MSKPVFIITTLRDICRKSTDQTVRLEAVKLLAVLTARMTPEELGQNQPSRALDRLPKSLKPIKRDKLNDLALEMANPREPEPEKNPTD